MSMSVSINKSALFPGVQAFNASSCQKFSVPADRCLGLGVFGDGVPYQKNKSIECITYNILGQGSQSQRYLFTAIPKTHTCKCGCGGRHTLDAMFKVLVWSFIVMMNGFFPSTRHDGTSFGKDEKNRQKLKGPLNFWAALLQVRGDWSWFKQVFGFPSWSSKNICWRCSAGTDDNPYIFGLPS